MHQKADSLVCLVDSKFRGPYGHYYDHVVESARAIKSQMPDRRVLVFSGPQKKELTEVLLAIH